MINLMKDINYAGDTTYPNLASHDNYHQTLKKWLLKLNQLTFRGISSDRTTTFTFTITAGATYVAHTSHHFEGSCAIQATQCFLFQSNFFPTFPQNFTSFFIIDQRWILLETSALMILRPTASTPALILTESSLASSFNLAEIAMINLQNGSRFNFRKEDSYALSLLDKAWRIPS